MCQFTLQLEWQFETLSGEDLARFSGLGGEYWSEFRSPLKGLGFEAVLQWYVVSVGLSVNPLNLVYLGI